MSLVDTLWLAVWRSQMLHYAALTGEQAAELEDESVLDDVETSCGIRAAQVWIPGLSDRLGARRCRVCCRAVGLPPGTGSPVNDPACRAVLGLDETKED